jgi:hypothetical protein
MAGPPPPGVDLRLPAGRPGATGARRRASPRAGTARMRPSPRRCRRSSPSACRASARRARTRSPPTEDTFRLLLAFRLELGTAASCAPTASRAAGDRPYRTRLFHPDGRVERLRDQGGGLATWVARRGTEGNHRVTVTRGGTTAAIAFRVVPAQSPHLVTPDRREESEVTRRLGRTVPILLTGLAPRARVWLALYRGSRRWVRPRCSGCSGTLGLRPPILQLGASARRRQRDRLVPAAHGPSRPAG